MLCDLILGHTPIGAVEIDPYCCSVLRARRDDGWFPGLAVHEIDIRDFDASEYAGRVDLIAGGFPCVDISVAGKGAGITGERSGLWKEFARIIGEIRPRYAFIENSPALVTRGLDVVLADLAALGMDAVWEVISAAQAGAPHRRERIWILAHANSVRQLQPEGRECDQRRRAGDGGQAIAIPDPDHQRLQGRGELGQSSTGREAAPGWGYDAAGCGGSPWRIPQSGLGVLADELPTELVPGWWDCEPDVGRVATGVKNRVSQLKALGNAQVPMQCAMAWRILSD